MGITPFYSASKGCTWRDRRCFVGSGLALISRGFIGAEGDGIELLSGGMLSKFPNSSKGTNVNGSGGW